MELTFGKDIISIDKFNLDLNNLSNSDLFLLFEKIIDNEKELELKKSDDITPLSSKFYDIIEQKIDNGKRE